MDRLSELASRSATASLKYRGAKLLLESVTVCSTLYNTTPIALIDRRDAACDVARQTAEEMIQLAKDLEEFDFIESFVG